MKVLVVDDERPIRQMLHRFLSNRGYDVTTVADGQTALETYQTDRYLLAIVDIMLPRIDGYELCRRIRTLPYGDQTTILAMTAYSSPDILEKIFEAGANDYITKPIELRQLQIRLKIAEQQVQIRLQHKKEKDELIEINKHLQRELAEHANVDQIYYTFVENTLQGLLILQNKMLIFANRIFSQISGYSVEQLKMMTPEELLVMIHPQDREWVWNRYLERENGKTIEAHYTIRGIRKDGEIRQWEILANRIEYLGKPAVQVAVLDITAEHS